MVHLGSTPGGATSLTARSLVDSGNDLLHRTTWVQILPGGPILKEINMKATMIQDNLENFNGHASLYKLDPPLDGNTYVVVSSVDAMFSGPETYIFPSDKKGVVSAWGELPGSFRGAKDHKQALENANYTVE